MLDVGGIGFELLTTRSAERLATPGEMVTVETFLHVREDALQLFGFADAGERSLFKLLMGVSGIGPKLALAIVSAYGPEQLQRAIASQDVALLASVSGVGRKTAQRICVDLKDKMGGVGAAAVASANGAAAVAAPGVPLGADLSDPYYGAREALVALGYSLADCEAALDGVEGTEDERVRAGPRAPARRGRAVIVDERMVDPAEQGPEDDGTLRPQRLSEFLGQPRVVGQLSVYLEAARGRGEACDHVLLAGPAGPRQDQPRAHRRRTRWARGSTPSRGRRSSARATWPRS